jgi:hypothetical protein
VQTWRNDPDGGGAGLPVLMGVLARRVELVTMVRMLDRPDTVAARCQMADKIDNQSCLAAVLATNDMEAFHPRDDSSRRPALPGERTATAGNP